MATVIRYPTANTPTTGFNGVANNPTNAYTDDATEADFTPSKPRNDENAHSWRGFDFSGIPDGSTIDSVTVKAMVRVSASNTASGAEWRVALFEDVTAATALAPGVTGAIGAVQYTRGFTDTTEFLWDLGTLSTEPTLAQLKATNFGVRIEAAHGNTGTSYSYYVDYIEVTVEWTANQPEVSGTISGGGGITATVVGPPSAYPELIETDIGNSATTASTYDVSLDQGDIDEGDLVILHIVGSSSTGPLTVPGGIPVGWTRIASGDNGDYNYSVFWHIITAADVLTPIATFGFDNSQYHAHSLQVILGGTFDVADPVDVTDIDLQAAANSTTISALTTGVDRLLVMGYGSDISSAATTSIDSGIEGADAVLGPDFLHISAYTDEAPTATTYTRTITTTSSSQDLDGFLVAVKPSTGPTASGTISGGGSFTATTESLETLTTSGSISGGGSIAAITLHNAEVSAGISGGGSIAATVVAHEGVAVSGTISGGGGLIALAVSLETLSTSGIVNGGGAITPTFTTNRLIATAISGGGGLTATITASTETTVVELKLDAGSAPYLTGRTVVWIRQKVSSSDLSDELAHTLAELYQGTTLIWSAELYNVTTTFGTWKNGLSLPQEASITDWTDLRIRLQFFNPGGETGELTVADVWLTTADISSQPTVAGTINGGGSITAVIISTRSTSGTISGGGSITASVTAAEHRTTSGTISGGGSITVTVVTARNLDVTLSGGGSIAATAVSTEFLTTSGVISGGGSLTATTTSHEAHSTSGAISSGGSITVVIVHNGTVAAGISGGGGLLGVTGSGVIISGTINGGGSISATVSKTASLSATLNGGGSIATTVVSRRSASVTLNFNNHIVSPFAGTQDEGFYEILDGGNRLRIYGNAWKRIDWPTPITADTMLEFDYQALVEGEIQAIGFSPDDLVNAAYPFQLFGVTVWATIQDYNDYQLSDGVKHYSIPVGQHYTGQFLYMTFIGDDDASSAVNDFYSNVTINQPFLQGSGSITAVVAATKEVSATVSGGGSLTASVTAHEGVTTSGTISGGGGLTATTVSTEFLTTSGTISGGGSITAALTASREIAAVISGGGSITATFTASREVVANISGGGSITGLVDSGATGYTELLYDATGDPLSSINHELYIRYKHPTGLQSDTLHFELRDGLTVIYSSSVATASTSVLEFTDTLTGVQADLITDYANLSLRTWMDVAATDTIQVTDTWLNIPPSAPQSTSGVISGGGSIAEIHTTHRTVRAFPNLEEGLLGPALQGGGGLTATVVIGVAGQTSGTISGGGGISAAVVVGRLTSGTISGGGGIIASTADVALSERISGGGGLTATVTTTHQTSTTISGGGSIHATVPPQYLDLDGDGFGYSTEDDGLGYSRETDDRGRSTQGTQRGETNSVQSPGRTQ